MNIKFSLNYPKGRGYQMSIMTGFLYVKETTLINCSLLVHNTLGHVLIWNGKYRGLANIFDFCFTTDVSVSKNEVRDRSVQA